MLLSNIGKVFSWEVRKNIKSPTFLILTFFVPLIMLAGMGISFFLTDSAVREEKKVAIIDETGEIFPMLSAGLEATNIKIFRYAPVEIEQLKDQVVDDQYDGLLVITHDAVKDGLFPYYVKDTRQHHPPIVYEVLRSTVINHRMLSAGLSSEQAAATIAPVRMRTLSVAGGEPSLAAFLVPFVFGMVLVFSAVFSGQVLMYGIIKEKRNRIVEILLSSVTSLELMLGKITGFGLLGLIQITIWISVGLLVGGRLFDLRELAMTPQDLLPSLMFFIGGYFLFAAMFAVMGATMKDAEGGSQMQGLVVLIPMVPIFASSGILMSPNAAWVQVFSFIPPFIPATMLLRVAAATLPWWEIGATFILLLLSIGVTIYLGSRIFDRSILLFEKTINIKDILKMLKK